MKLKIHDDRLTVISGIDAIENRVDKLELTTDAKLKEAINGVEAKIDNAMIEVEKTFIEVIRYTDTEIDNAIDAYDAQLQPTEIIVGVHPKKQSKHKLIQWLLIKLFGYELEYKTVMAKTIVIKPEDYPFYDDEDIELTF